MCCEKRKDIVYEGNSWESERARDPEQMWGGNKQKLLTPCVNQNALLTVTGAVNWRVLVRKG